MVDMYKVFKDEVETSYYNALLVVDEEDEREALSKMYAVMNKMLDKIENDKKLIDQLYKRP